jgi:uncharacterized protein YaaW (UPF0174 family)
VARYQGRLSGPLLDRIDLQVEVPAVKTAELLAHPEAEGSTSVATRVAAARARQTRRQGWARAAADAACERRASPITSTAAGVVLPGSVPAAMALLRRRRSGCTMRRHHAVARATPM